MSLHVRRAIAVAVCLTMVGTLHAIAGGLYGVTPFYTLDLSETFERLSIAGENAFSAMESLLSDLGVPPAELAAIHDEFSEVMLGIKSQTAQFPAILPVPLLGAGIELRLPLVLIDAVRLSGGFLTDALIRSGAQLASLEIPDPLVDAAFEFGTYSGSVVADLAFSSWMLSTEAVKRFDLLVMALDLGAGVDLIHGRVDVPIGLDVPVHLESGMADAIDALHLDGLHWSSFAIHGTLGFEIGLPFLRLYGDIRWLIPVGQTEEWWGIHVAPIAGMIGFVIRF